MAEVKFKFTGDDSELRKKLADLAKLQAEMSEQFGKNLKKSLSGFADEPLKNNSSSSINQQNEVQKKLIAAQL